VAAVVAVAAVIVAAAVLISSADDSGSSDGVQAARERVKALKERPSAKIPEASSAEPASLVAGIPQTGNVLGEPDAPVTLHEFADLQCPFCRDYATKTFPTIVNDYVRSGKVKVVFRDYAILGPDSIKAALAAEAAGKQNKMFDFVEAFYANQGEENSGYVTDDFVKKLAAGVPGLDVDRLLADRTDPTIRQALAKVQRDAQQNRLTGTPSFLLQQGTGAPKQLNVSGDDVAAFKAALDKAVAGG
jgi:protein-disulfide isomerase